LIEHRLVFIFHDVSLEDLFVLTNVCLFKKIKIKYHATYEILIELYNKVDRKVKIRTIEEI
jgi:hypothetical protein